MSFFDEIIKTVNLSGFVPSFKATILGNNALYLENVRKIIGFSSSSIVLALNKQVIELQGQDLCVKKYCSGDMLICGKISGILIK